MLAKLHDADFGCHQGQLIHNENNSIYFCLLKREFLFLKTLLSIMASHITKFLKFIGLIST